MRISLRSAIDFFWQQGRWNRMVGGGQVMPAPTHRSGDKFCARSWPSCWTQCGSRSGANYSLSLRGTWLHVLGCEIKQLAAQKVGRRPIVQLDVMKWIGNDLGRPDQPRLHILDLEQMKCSEQQSADADGQPKITEVLHEFAQ